VEQRRGGTIWTKIERLFGVFFLLFGWWGGKSEKNKGESGRLQILPNQEMKVIGNTDRRTKNKGGKKGRK